MPMRALDIRVDNIASAARVARNAVRGTVTSRTNAVTNEASPCASNSSTRRTSKFLEPDGWEYANLKLRASSESKVAATFASHSGAYGVKFSTCFSGRPMNAFLESAVARSTARFA